MRGVWTAIDGNEACAGVAYRLSDEHAALIARAQQQIARRPALYRALAADRGV
ncbi:MAG TPA: hypothetical protein VGQ16_08670 [Vicinamibacterales bacterium]|jgi:hypothetical protein|nr:hypothetical protein [Vicinamibacterales bacterium]